ncbi:MAG: 30S ribosomal protein S6 [bacterium]
MFLLLNYITDYGFGQDRILTIRLHSANMDLMYELTYIINPNLSEQEVAAQTDKVRGFINGFGGEIKNEKLMEKRRLAYPVKKQGYGFYVTIEFNLQPENVAEVDGKIKLEQAVLRHLLITKEIIKETPRKPYMARLKEKPAPGVFKTIPPEKQEKVKIEEIDKKLEELLEQ